MRTGLSSCEQSSPERPINRNALRSVFHRHPILQVLTLAFLSANSAFGQNSSAISIEQTIAPVFPSRLIAEGYRKGEAHVVVSMDASGALTDLLVTGYTHADFAAAAVKSIRQWHFTPTQTNAQARASAREITLLFETSQVLVEQHAPDYTRSLLKERERDALIYRPRSLKELDSIPVPVAIPSPIYTDELAARGITGEVAVEFYIDEEGRVRIPAILASAADELSSLAIEAVREWRFEPPKYQGRPAIVHAVQKFKFFPTK